MLTMLRKLALEVASLKQELSSLKQDWASSPKGESSLQRDPEEDRENRSSGDLLFNKLSSADCSGHELKGHGLVPLTGQVATF